MRGTFLGFDFGTKYLGIAVGQTITQTARPLVTLVVHKGVPHWETLDKIIQEWQPQAFIVGLAIQPDGSHSATSKKALKFGKSLQSHYNIAVHYIEERLTSVAAKERIKENVAMTAIEKDLDAVAAAIILESWLHGLAQEIGDATV
ncbi:MAG: Holliday junction resolvase RuvX [Candidatus Berkiella sp.]